MPSRPKLSVVYRLLQRSSALLLLVVGCPQTMPPMIASDAGVEAGPGDGAAAMRRILFETLPQGVFVSATVDGVMLRAGPYRGNQVVRVEPVLSSLADLLLGCGELEVRPPEPHAAFRLVFNDDNAPLTITMLDANGQPIGQRPVDTRLDAAGLVDVDGIYKALDAKLAPGQMPIASMKIAGCDDYLRELVWK